MSLVVAPGWLCRQWLSLGMLQCAMGITNGIIRHVWVYHTQWVLLGPLRCVHVVFTQACHP